VIRNAGRHRVLSASDTFDFPQRKAGPEYLRLSIWMAQLTALDFAICVVSLHEHVVGAHAFLNHAENTLGLIR
jgi:tRNA(fMet)-specific endonuclease VapC